MITMRKTLIDSQQWYSSPDTSHLVEFYSSEQKLINNLRRYVSEGLAEGDTCVVIAAKEHQAKLDSQLSEIINVAEARSRGQYLTLDAAETLDRFMVGGLPHKQNFSNSVGQTIKQLAAKGRPIRAYGEMVALLWKDSNRKAVLKLEELWNELAAQHSFSLYCAYPELHLIMHPEVRQEICQRHNLHA